MRHKKHIPGLIILLPLLGTAPRIIKNNIESPVLLVSYFGYLCVVVVALVAISILSRRFKTGRLRLLISIAGSLIFMLLIHSLLAFFWKDAFFYFLNIKNSSFRLILLVSLFRAALIQSLLYVFETIKQRQDESGKLEVGNNGDTAANTTKKILLAKYRDTIIPTPADAIAYLQLSSGMVCQNNFDGKKYFHNIPLEKLAETLDPDFFFRANRQFLIHRNAINQIRKADNRKLEIQLTTKTEERIQVSKARAGAFMKWLNK
jgi:LytTr DNA-binding domain